MMYENYINKQQQINYEPDTAIKNGQVHYEV